jgi:hypothetical protein
LFIAKIYNKNLMKFGRNYLFIDVLYSVEGTSSGEELEAKQDEEEEVKTQNGDLQEVEEPESDGKVTKEGVESKPQEHVVKSRHSGGEEEKGNGEKIVSTVIKTSSEASECVESKLVKTIKEKLSMAKPEQCNDSDDDGGENEMENESGRKEEEVHVIIKDKPLDYRTKSSDVNDSKQSKFIEQLDESSTTSAKQNGEDSGVESGLDGPGESSEKPGDKVETSLSWEEKPQVDSMSSTTDVTDLTNHDHRTQCAFSFSNAIMFDLDVD